MVGNDVVDLADPDCAAGARHPRFDERVFAPSERRSLDRPRAESALRWILWAAKEAAYKVAKRLDPSVRFAPIRFVASLDGNGGGQVRHGAARYPVRVSVCDRRVHAIAAEPGGSLGSVLAGVRPVRCAIPGALVGERELARAFALADLATRTGLPRESLSIERIRRIPQLLRDGERMPLSLSLSHHGRFVAYAAAPAATDRG